MRTFLITVVLLACAGALWWLTRDPGPAAPVASGDVQAREGDDARARVDAVSLQDAGKVDATDAQRTEVAQVAPPAAADGATPDTTVIRGRCVDVSAAPVANVRAALHGYVRDEAELARYLRDHAPIAWRDPAPVMTGTDGRFEFRVTAPAPHQFGLHLSAVDRVPMGAWWQTLTPGTVVDLGDILMRVGVQVRGRVSDAAGTPLSGITVRLSRITDGTPVAGLRSSTDAETRSATDGMFRMPNPVADGPWTLSLSRATLVDPDPRIELAGSDHDLAIVAKPDSSADAIAGTVVDTLGIPVPNADVRRAHDYQGPTVVTRRDGSFRLQWPAGAAPAEPIALQVTSRTHQRLQTDAVHRVGASDVRLVVREGITLEVRARRESDGTPVEQFGVRLLPKSDVDFDRTGTDGAVRGGWNHPLGIARIRGVKHGTYFVCVEPTPTTGLANVWFIETVVADGAPTVVEVPLQAPVARAVVVERADGAPVVGAKVELLTAIGAAAIDVTTEACELDTYLGRSPGYDALLVASAKTDGDGTCTFDGPAARTFAVRVTGDGFVPAFVGGVRLAVAEPLRVVVSGGATVRGRITPIEVLHDLDDLAGRTREPASTDAFVTRVAIANADAPIAADGTFVVDGVPPGTWDLSWRVQRRTGSGRTTALRPLRKGLVLVDGATVEVDLDLAALRPARLRATVMLDDVPFEGAVFVARADQAEGYGARTDAAGRIDALLAPGAWSVRVQRHDGPAAYTQLAAGETVTLAPGQATEATFRVRTARAKLRVLAPDGTPAARVVLDALPSGGRPYVLAPATDADGRVEVAWTPGEFELRTRVRSLTAEADWRAFTAQNRDAQTQANAFVVVGRVTLPATGEEITLRLPPEWDK